MLILYMLRYLHSITVSWFLYNMFNANDVTNRYNFFFFNLLVIKLKKQNLFLFVTSFMILYSLMEFNYVLLHTIGHHSSPENCRVRDMFTSCNFIMTNEST